MNTLQRAAASALATLVTTAGDPWGELPIPHGAPIVHASGADADRILMIGGETVRGAGVASHELGLGGQLAPQLAALTGRGADIEMLGVPRLTLDDMFRLISPDLLPRFDAIVIMVGRQEALCLYSARAWRLGIEGLIARLDEAAPNVPVLVLGIVPEVRKLAPRVLQGAVARSIERLNAETRAACAASSTVHYLPFTPLIGDLNSSDLFARSFEDGARVIAPVLAALCPGIRHPGLPVDEGARQSAVDAIRSDAIRSDAIRSDATSVDEQLERIVELASQLLDVRGAAVTLIDRQVQRVRAAYGLPREDTPRIGAFCATTIHTNGPYVVEDALRVPEVSGYPWVVGPEQVRFYAGYPLEAPGGERVGAFCIVDREPRTFSPREAALLRDLALKAQALLWVAAGVA